MTPEEHQKILEAQSETLRILAQAVQAMETRLLTIEEGRVQRELADDEKQLRTEKQRLRRAAVLNIVNSSYTPPGADGERFSTDPAYAAEAIYAFAEMLVVADAEYAT